MGSSFGKWLLRTEPESLFEETTLTPSPREKIKFGVLQEHNCLSVLDLAILDLPEYAFSVLVPDSGTLQRYFVTSPTKQPVSLRILSSDDTSSSKDSAPALSPD